MKFKKIPYYLSLTLLTFGSSLILGLLSFGGMYALYPFLGPAFATFGLSVAYEGEIYLKSIIGAFKKLFGYNYLENLLAREYLGKSFPDDVHTPECPQFFKDYQAQFELLEAFGHKKLNKESKKRKKDIEKTLSHMEKWFALQLFPNHNEGEAPAYAQELRTWFDLNGQKEWQDRLRKRHFLNKLVFAFSAITAAFMALSSTYLLLEAFETIPLLSTIAPTLLPILITPMAIISGIAYGKLTYNTIRELIDNKTVTKWFAQLSKDLGQGLTVHNVFMATMTAFLISLALFLTVCTAGTWWTIATKSTPLFDWMKKMPSWVMGIANPIVSGLSAVAFNLQNTTETLKSISQADFSKFFIVRAFMAIKHEIKEFYAAKNKWPLINPLRPVRAIIKAIQDINPSENFLQKINPPRLFIKFIINPLHSLMFIGHTGSMSFTADRAPWFPHWVSLVVNWVSEVAEDYTFFFGGKHGHSHQKGPSEQKPAMKELIAQRLNSECGHSHDNDIPTKIFNIISKPFQYAAAKWDSYFSQWNQSTHQKQPEQLFPLLEEKGTSEKVRSEKKVLSHDQAMKKLLGKKDKAKVDVTILEDAAHPSEAWKVAYFSFLIKRHERKNLNNVCLGSKAAKQDRDKLAEVETTAREALYNNADVNQAITQKLATFGTFAFQETNDLVEQQIPRYVTAY